MEHTKRRSRYTVHRVRVKVEKLRPDVHRVLPRDVTTRRTQLAESATAPGLLRATDGGRIKSDAKDLRARVSLLRSGPVRRGVLYGLPSKDVARTWLDVFSIGWIARRRARVYSATLLVDLPRSS